MNKLTCVLPLFVAASAFGQDVPPPPKPADGPSLEVTMRYIQDRLNGEGKVSERLLSADGEVNSPASVASHSTVNAVADAASCTLSFKSVFGSGDTFGIEWNYKLSFRDVDRLLVESSEDAERRTIAALGFDPSQYRHSPTIFLVTLVLSSGKTIPVRSRTTDPKGVVTEKDNPQKEASAYFREEDAAQRMAKAMVHAVEIMRWRQ